MRSHDTDLIWAPPVCRYMRACRRTHLPKCLDRDEPLGAVAVVLDGVDDQGEHLVHIRAECDLKG